MPFSRPSSRLEISALGLRRRRVRDQDDLGWLDPSWLGVVGADRDRPSPRRGPVQV